MPLSKLKADSLNLGDTFVFTGDVTGEATGALTLLQTQTASGESSIQFTSGIDSTYDEYWFIINNYHPTGNTDGLFVNFSTDGGSNWNVTKTTTSFGPQHGESNSPAQLDYQSGYDLAQSTSDVRFSLNVYTGNDECMSGILKLYNPSSTTYVKHFMSITNTYFASARSFQIFTGGYCNTTSAINGVIFRPNANAIEDCTIQMFGVTQ